MIAFNFPVAKTTLWTTQNFHIKNKLSSYYNTKSFMERLISHVGNIF